MVLRGLGWRLHRIWSTDWWSNPQQELAKVDDVLNHLLLNNDNSTAIPTVAEDSEKQTETKTEDAKEGMPYASLATTEALNAEDDLNLLFPLEIPKPSVYVRASLQSFEASDAFYERSADTLIQSSIVSILKLEAPITADILVKRISESWGFGRSGNRIRERIVKLIPRGTPRTTESGVIFFWPEGTQPATYSGFRINSPDVEAMRDVDEICKQELANLLLYAVKQHAGVSEQQVVRDACHLLGIRRITEKASERMTSVLKKMVKGQVISIVGESLV